MARGYVGSTRPLGLLGIRWPLPAHQKGSVDFWITLRSIFNAIVKDLDSAFTALADPHRRQVVDLLRTRPYRAGELAAATGLSAPALSRHLRVLRHGGLIEPRLADHDGRLHIYSLRRDPFTSLRQWLDQVEEFWTLQLGSFRAFADSKSSEVPK